MATLGDLSRSLRARGVTVTETKAGALRVTPVSLLTPDERLYAEANRDALLRALAAVDALDAIDDHAESESECERAMRREVEYARRRAHPVDEGVRENVEKEDAARARRSSSSRDTVSHGGRGRAPDKRPRS
jgi:hypothetical protein